MTPSSFTKSRPILWMALAVFLVSACNYQVTRIDPQASNQPVFVAPTLVVIEPIAQTTAASVVPGPTALPTSSVNQPSCVDDLTFVDDINYPDGTQVNHGTIIQKQWSVMNTGTCIWTAGYTVRKIDGPEMSANPSQALPAANSGETVTIGITFIAPTTPGAYKSTWQAYNPAGEKFGKPFYIDITVSQ
jgi:Ig-like domain from next to BRCA1 gene